MRSMTVIRSLGTLASMVQGWESGNHFPWQWQRTKSKILCGLIQEWESRNQFQRHKIGYNQVKYRWRKLTNKPKQGLNRIYYCYNQVTYMSNKLTSNPKNKVVIGSIIVQKRRILAGLVPELEARNQFQWQKIGYNQVKYSEGRWRTIPSKVLIGSIIMPKSKIPCGLVQEWESSNQF